MRNDYAFKLGEVASSTGLPSSRINTYVLKGKVVPTIVEHIELHKHDMMILGGTGKTYNIGDHFLGTLMDKIVHKSSVPVLIVKTKIELDETGKVVLIDDFQSLDTLIRRVKAVRKLWDAKIDIVRINTPRNFMSDVDFNNLLADRRKDSELQGCSFHSFNHDTVADGVVYYSMRVKADMLVVGGKHQSQMRRWFLQEDLAEQIIGFAEVPVLILD